MEKLKIKIDGLFRKGRDFLENIKSSDRVILIYHNDVDGVASAHLLLNVLEKMGKKVAKSVFQRVEWMGNLGEVVEKFDKIIILDISSDLVGKNSSGKKKMLLIDHHPGKDLNSENIVFINPRIFDKKIYQPASYLVYKMFPKILRDEKWVAKIGTVGDYGIADCEDLVKIKNEKNIWKTKYGKASMVMNGSIAVAGPEKTLNWLMNSKSLKDFLKNKKILSAFNSFEDEMKRVEIEHRKNREVFGKVVVSVVSAKYKRIGSTLATKLGTKYPDKIFFIFEKTDGKYRVHGRCESCEGVNIGNIFRKFGVGGGHEKSGAGTVKEMDLQSFKRKLIEELGSFSG